ncbi:spore coat protein [Paenibacillus sp. PL2-23]|uniref:spore coat protein n=1 Tax=Paenibacillus sp. PL2-23 TaxID=2100729 RepID=UPI0030FBB9F5
MQHQQAQQPQHLMNEEDLASTVLADLKRVVREYATAATESTCPDIRQLFTKLLDNTLRAQGQLFQAMQQSNMYNAASPALRQELDKQAQHYQQTAQKTQQQLQQKLGGMMPHGAMMNGNQNQQGHQQPMYM